MFRRKAASSSASALPISSTVIHQTVGEVESGSDEQKDRRGNYFLNTIRSSVAWKACPVKLGLSSLILLMTILLIQSAYRYYTNRSPSPSLDKSINIFPVDDLFDIRTDHLPLGEEESLIRIQELEHMTEGIIPLVVTERLEKETPNGKRLRLLGNRALVQYGNRLRNLIMQGNVLFRPIASPDSLLDNSYNDSDFLLALRKRIHDLAPWLKGDFHQKEWPKSQFPTMHPDPNSKALVICAGDKQYAYLDSLVHTIRVVHQSPITIHITYKGEPDLSLKSRQTLANKFGNDDNLNFVDLTRIFDLDAAKLSGWNLRIFGLLAVPEANLAMLDVDVILYQPPEKLFQLNGYQQMGALFFHDRIAPDRLWQPRQLLVRLQPHPSWQAQRALTNGEMPFNEHVQESGVVLINKARRYLGLWAACFLLGRWDIRRFAQRDLVYGDKEFYWIAFESVNEQYTFSKYYPGCIGSVLTDFNGNDSGHSAVTLSDMASINSQENIALCGRLLHLDDSGQPLWSNGGYLTKEDDKDSKEDISQLGLKPIMFIDGGHEYGPAGKPGLNQYWKYHEEMGVTCLYPNSRKIQQVPTEMVKKGADAVKYYLLTAS